MSFAIRFLPGDPARRDEPARPTPIEPGSRFGRFVVLRRDDTRDGRYAMWLCRCDCGNERTVYAANLRSGHSALRSRLASGWGMERALSPHTKRPARGTRDGIVQRVQRIVRDAARQGFVLVDDAGVALGTIHVLSAEDAEALRPRSMADAYAALNPKERRLLARHAEARS